MSLVTVNKPEDCIIVLSNGGFNDAYILRDLVKDPKTRYKRFYVMNVKTNPSIQKYIELQIQYCRGMYVGVDIRYFGISDIPIYTELSTKEIIETYINNAILGYFEPHFAYGADIQIYIGFDSTSYVDIELDDKLKNRIHYPLKDKEENFAMIDLMKYNQGLFRICTTCDNATEEIQWCGHSTCYDCLYLIHTASMKNYLHINSMEAYWLREIMLKWFNISLPKNDDEIKLIQNNNGNIGCGCARCLGFNDDSFILSNTNGYKKVTYGSRAKLELYNYKGDINIQDIQEEEEEE